MAELSVLCGLVDCFGAGVTAGDNDRDTGHHYDDGFGTRRDNQMTELSYSAPLGRPGPTIVSLQPPSAAQRRTGGWPWLV
jgi:hypothetical protein